MPGHFLVPETLHMFISSLNSISFQIGPNNSLSGVSSMAIIIRILNKDVGFSNPLKNGFQNPLANASGFWNPFFRGNPLKDRTR